MVDTTDAGGADDQPGSGRRGPKKRLGTIGVVVLVIAIFGVGAYIVAAPTLDTIDQHWVTCEVHSAKPVSSTGRSATQSVRLSTSCGDIWFDHRVTSKNSARIAKGFRSHKKYDFKLGWLSQMYVRLGVGTPNAQAWRASS